MNFIIFIIFITCFLPNIHGYNYDAGNIGHNPYMDDKTRSSFKRRNILGQNLDKNGKTKHIPLYSRYNNNKRYDKLDYKTHFIEPTNDPIVNEYILNKKLISEPRKINLDAYFSENLFDKANIFGELSKEKRVNQSTNSIKINPNSVTLISYLNE